jgi:ribosomal protein L30/L7E
MYIHLSYGTCVTGVHPFPRQVRVWISTHTTLVIVDSTPYGNHLQSTQVSETIEASSTTRKHLSSIEIDAQYTHYKITLHHSAIVLPQRYKAALVVLGITVYHPHTPNILGKVSRIKELVHVENVPASSVRTKTVGEATTTWFQNCRSWGSLRHTNDYHICEYMLVFL